MKSSETPTGRPSSLSPNTSINSPEFRESAIRDLKDCIRRGHCKLAEGNELLDPPTPPSK